jgi:hypothetical protein
VKGLDLVESIRHLSDMTGKCWYTHKCQGKLVQWEVPSWEEARQVKAINNPKWHLHYCYCSTEEGTGSLESPKTTPPFSVCFRRLFFLNSSFASAKSRRVVRQIEMRMQLCFSRLPSTHMHLPMC